MAYKKFTKIISNPVPIGIIAAIVLTLGSFGGGAIRYRGGVLDTLGLGFLSYGHGQGISNAFMLLGTVLLVITWVSLGRVLFRGKLGFDKRMVLVKRTLYAVVIPLLFAAPMMSRDVYSYLMQGAMLRDGFDPYTEGAAVNPGPMLLEVSHDWRNTTTPYGPLHLWIGEMVTAVVGDSVTAGVIMYKLLSTAGFLAIAFAIPRIAGHFGADRAVALWLGVANPVMIIHMIGGMHNESMMVGLVSVGLLLALNRRFALGVALIAVAVSMKATAAIALPFVVWIGMHQMVERLTKHPTTAMVSPSNKETAHLSPGDEAEPAPMLSQKIIAFFATGAVGVFITGAVVSVITWASGASWGWISEISGNSKVINPLAMPSLVAGLISSVASVFTDEFDYNAVVGVLRTVSMVLMLLGLMVCWWLFRQNARRAIMGTTAAYTVAFIFNSVTLPWYYASLITLVGTFNPPPALLKFATGASIFIALMFTGSGNHQLYTIPTVILAAIAGWLSVLFIFEKHPLKAAAPEPSTAV
ncbi:MAG: alpha-(1-_6)-mannopyranosyltransferase A [Corynebacterium sp.]|nr:alpha-(1->6)-mannopyranosyltransferase A [Corynebacterium sp.]